MITKIEKIKNLGIFSDYKWDSSLPEFKRFNLIYGWNGSGKTTLSQLFASLEKNKSEIYPRLEYKIQTTAGNVTQEDVFTKKIRVFNQDYISENIDISSGTANSIFILGKENKELAEGIKQDEKILYGDSGKKDDFGKINELDQNKKELKRKENEKGRCFTDVARCISSNISGVSARNYRKPDAEAAFAKLRAKHLLTEDEIERCLLTLRQEEKPHIPEIKIGTIEKEANSITQKSKTILQRTVETVIIERLKENPDISKWVEQGLELHMEKKSSDCEFCKHPFTQKRLSELHDYFNDDDRKLKDDINILVSGIEQLYTKIENLDVSDKANFYGELQNDYSLKVDNFTKYKTDLLKNISKIKGEVEKKELTQRPLWT